MTRTPDRPPSFPAKMPVTVGLLAIASLVFGLGTWSLAARIDGAVLASGLVVLDQNRQAVQHPDGGVVDKILVQEGDSVVQGQVLIQLDPTLTQSELSIVENQLFEMMARRGRLEAERDEKPEISFEPELLTAAAASERIANLVEGQRSLFAARLDSYGQSITQLKAQQIQLESQIDGIDAQMEAVDRQLALTVAEGDVQQVLLDKGLTQSSKVLNLRREDARLSGMKGEATARKAQAYERIAETRIEILKLLSNRREEAITVLRDLQINELEMIERRVALADRLDRMDIQAPVAGVVYDLRVFGPKSVIRPADPLLYIVPQDRPLIIEARVNPISVNKVFLTQDVVVRLQSVDARTMPDLLGKVTRISPDAFVDPKTGGSYYRAEVELGEAELSKLPAGLIIIPGMPVDTFIKTGENSPLAYIAAPLVRYFGTAMR